MLSRFSAMICKRDNFGDFLFAFLHNKFIYSKRKEFAPHGHGSNFFPFWVDSFSEGRQNKFDRVTPPPPMKVYPFPLIFTTLWTESTEEKHDDEFFFPSENRIWRFLQITIILFIPCPTIVAEYYGFIWLSMWLSFHPSVMFVSLYFRFRMVTWVNKYKWIFPKLGMCIDILEIWFGIANGPISSVFDSFRLRHVSIFVSVQ